jgi:hypothetical protein
MSIPVRVRSAFAATDHFLDDLDITPNEIQQGAGIFGSTYILRMGLHYQRYVVAGYLPNWSIVHDIYLAANPAPRLTTKKRSSSVTGNIGETVLGIMSRFPRSLKSFISCNFPSSDWLESYHWFWLLAGRIESS